MIPISRPSLNQKEAQAAGKVILSGWVTQGPKVEAFEKFFASYVGARYACCASSCTTALHLALLAVGVKPGNVVLTVSHSFISTANAVRYCGGEPGFVDIDPDTYNISPRDLARCLDQDCAFFKRRLFYKNVSALKISESPLRFVSKNSELGRVAAILVVHQMGLPCDLKEILKIAKQFKLPVVEDAACAIGSQVKVNDRFEKVGKPHGDVVCFSFHPRKIVTTGDGGMLTTNIEKYDKAFRLLRHQGMNVSDLKRHKLKKIIFEKYVVSGFNYRMTDIQAAVGIEQLKKLPGFLKERRQLAQAYRKELQEVPWLQIPRDTSYAKTNWQSFPVRVLSFTPVSRNRLMQILLKMGFSTKPGIMNAHQEKPFFRRGLALKESEKARDHVILLPMFNGLKKKDIKALCRIIQQIR